MTVPVLAQDVTFAGAETTVPASSLSDPYGVAMDGAGDQCRSLRQSHWPLAHMWRTKRKMSGMLTEGIAKVVE
jgi:hypothetical protein